MSQPKVNIFLEDTAPFIYPSYNKLSFPHYFYERLKEEKPVLSRKFIPIYFDEMLNSVDKCRDAIQEELYKHTEDSFVITGMRQFDIPKNILNFSPDGKADIPLPYLSSYWDVVVKPINKRSKWTFFAGTFLGKRIVLQGRNDCIENTLNTPDYFNALADTLFALCPEGIEWGTNRLYEAIHSGAIPVYISDTHWLPFSEMIDWSKFCICIKWDQLDKLDSILVEVNTGEMRAEGEKVKFMFSPEFTYDYIINKVTE